MADLGEGENAIVDGPFGSNLKTSDYIDDKNNGIPVLTTKNLEGDYSNNAVRFISHTKYKELQRSEVKGGDIIIAKIGSIGKTGIYPVNMKQAIIPANLLKFTVSKQVCLKYVYHYITSPYLQSLIKKISKATAQPAFNLTQFRLLPIAIPPLPEQRAIVAKLETLLSDLDNAVASLKLAKEQIKTYRQSVLKAAFTGKLTEDWRKQHTDLTSYNLAKSDARMRELQTEYPSGWKIYGFKDVCTINSNLVNPADYLNYPHIAPDNIEKESGLLLGYKTIEEDKVFSPKHKFHKGQIVYSKIRPYLSKVVLVGFVGLCSADMYPLTSKINSKFLLYYMLSSTFVGMASTAGTRSVLPKINQRELSIIPVPVPSVEEQQEIVNGIETRFSVADKLNQTLDESLSKAEALKQSLLKQAFEGKLLTDQELEQTRQAADWEPAEKLLESIKLAKLR